MAAIARRAASSASASKTNQPVAELSADAALDEFDRLAASLCVDKESDKERCIACVERCDEIWSDAADDGASRDEVANLPHLRAIASLGVAMWLSCHRGDMSSKTDRKLFVYACMLLSAVLAPIADQEHDDDPATATALVDSAEAQLRDRTEDPCATLPCLLSLGLQRLNSLPSPSADVAVAVLRALQTLITALTDSTLERELVSGDIGVVSGCSQALPAQVCTTVACSATCAPACVRACIHTHFVGRERRHFSRQTASLRRWRRRQPTRAASPSTALSSASYSWHLTLTLHPSPLTRHPSPLTRHPSSLTAQRSPCTAHRSPLTAHRSPLTAHRAPRTSHRAPLTAHRAPSPRHPTRRIDQRPNVRGSRPRGRGDARGTLGACIGETSSSGRRDGCRCRCRRRCRRRCRYRCNCPPA